MPKFYKKYFTVNNFILLFFNVDLRGAINSNVFKEKHFLTNILKLLPMCKELRQNLNLFQKL